MPVICCNHEVSIRKMRTAKAPYVPAGIPTWRGHCRGCGKWYCGRGHDTGPHQDAIWMGKTRVCQQGDCKVFYDAWLALWRRATKGSSKPVLSDGQQVNLRDWAAAHPGVQADAVREFLDYFFPTKPTLPAKAPEPAAHELDPGLKKALRRYEPGNDPLVDSIVANLKKKKGDPFAAAVLAILEAKNTGASS